MKEPLAFRMRPTKIDEIIGQTHLVGKNKFISNCVESKNLINIILYGNPGIGKTSLANALIKSLGLNSYKINATNTSKQEMIDVFKEASNFYPSVVIIDEIHQLDKSRQNILLPLIEEGKFVIIGTTTANPMISINPAIRSRVRLLELKPLTNDEIVIGLKRALKSEKGLNNEYKFEDKALLHLAQLSKGDLRFALNLLETCTLNYLKNQIITLDMIKQMNFIPNYLADRDENEHYNTVSAFQKSIRGGDVDAALFYLAKLIRANDIEGINRRLVVTAYEDIGLANPQAVERAVLTVNAVNNIGLPEARILLAFSVIELTLSPKSHSAEASIDKALSFVDTTQTSVREYLRLNNVEQDIASNYPYGKYSIYPHLIYLPKGLENTRMYDFNLTSKYEQALVENYKKHLSLEKSSNIEYVLSKFLKLTNK